MKVCENCGKEIATIDGDNKCVSCKEAEEIKRRQRRQRSRECDQAMCDLGLVKVRGALDGVYWA